MEFSFSRQAYKKVIFLAGPIRGTESWHDKAIRIISSIDDETYVVSPNKRLCGDNLEKEKSGNLEKFERQTHWERYYLGQASKKGAIMFWLANQTERMYIHDNFYGFPAPYARDTRGELGGWGWGQLMHDKDFPIVVGAEDKFLGLDVIKANFLEVKPDMQFYSTLEKTCLRSVMMTELRNFNQKNKIKEETPKLSFMK